MTWVSMTFERPFDVLYALWSLPYFEEWQELSAKSKGEDWNSRSVEAWKLKAGPSPSGSSGESTGVEQL